MLTQAIREVTQRLRAFVNVFFSVAEVSKESARVSFDVDGCLDVRQTQTLEVGLRLV